jgi:malonate decarboxylase alpha subunit
MRVMNVIEFRTRSSDLPMTSLEVSTPKSWTTRRERKNRRLQRVARYCSDHVLDSGKIIKAMEELIEPGDRICLEGNNQKQADFLSRMLAQVDAERIHGLHLLISVLSRSEHMDLFERGIANRVDFSFSGPQAIRLAEMVAKSQIQIGGIHTYLELYGRYFIDLTPDISFIAADCADKDGNLYTGANTEETPVIAEATAFRDGIVVAQVNEIRERVPRVDIPGSWIDLIVVADRPYAIEPLFTRDPALITDVQILMAMLVIRGVYERHGVRRLNHGIGFDTAAIELLLPTYGEWLGLRGTICTNWILNPHPTLIPAIESGWVESVHCFGGEVGMERYVAARPDIFFTGADGSLRSNRAFSQIAGLYATDLFIGSTLQMDGEANSSTATSGRIAGFGGAPNMGSDSRGRRHATPAWLEMSSGSGEQVRGRKIVVQLVQTFREGMQPSFVETLDAIAVGRDARLAVPPIMIYGDDVTHVVTEEGIAYLYRVNSLRERRAALSAIAGVTTLGAESSHEARADLRKRGIVALPEDLGIRRSDARRSLLAAHSVKELVEWSGGLYNPPMRFRSW